MIRRTLGILLVGNGNGVQGLGAGVLSVGRGMVHHFLRMKVCQLVDFQEHTSSFLINIRAELSRIVGEDSKVQPVSASWLQQFFVFFFESEEDISRGPAQARTTWYAYEWGCRPSILEGLW